MLQLLRVLQSGSRNFMRNLWLSTAATAVMTVTLTVVVMSFISNSALTSTIRGVTDKITLSVYLKNGITTEQQTLVRQHLENTGNVSSITYVTKDEALKRYKEANRNNPTNLEAVNITGNPLPASYEVRPKDQTKLRLLLAVAKEDAIRPLLDDNPVSLSGSRKDAINNIVNGSNFIIKLGLIASLIFLVISTLIIFNTIRMAIFTRRDEIEIMKLVGATKWFIRGPFLFEATLYGIVGAIIATTLAYALLLGVGPKLSHYIDVGATMNLFSSYPLIIIGSEILIGVFIGAVSSLLAMSRYLKL